MKTRNVRLTWLFSAWIATVGAMATAPTVAQDSSPEADTKALSASVDKALEFLRTRGQASDGSFSSQMGPAVTAIVVAGALRHGRTMSEPLVAKGLKYLEGFVQQTGGIHAPKSKYQNYETCLCVMCFSAANADHKYDELLKNADKFLKGQQLDEKRGVEKSHPSYGGISYGSEGTRADLSLTHFLVEALKETGNDYNSDSIQKALVFVSNCQNLEGPHNNTPFGAKINDGSFYYTPDIGGEGKKGADGGLRGYGSMTYAGLKSMIFAGVGPDDPRVKAAVEWAQKNYDLQSNPGMGSAGLYYYYHLFSKALDAVGEEQFKDAQGKVHPWRAELRQAVISRQAPNGSWVNDNAKWMEGDPNLVTGYALLTLAYCRPDQVKK